MDGAFDTLTNLSINFVSSAVGGAAPQVFDLLDTVEAYKGVDRFQIARDSSEPINNPLLSNATRGEVLEGAPDSVLGLTLATVDTTQYTGIGGAVVDDACESSSFCEPAWLLGEFELRGVATSGQTSVWLQIGSLGANHGLEETYYTSIAFGSGAGDPAYNASDERGLTSPSDTADLIVTAIEFMPGDYNHDGVVDAADYTVYRDGSLPYADGNFDGVVDAEDYYLWAGNYGSSVVGTAVAEPASVGLALVIGAVAICWRPALRTTATLALAGLLCSWGTQSAAAPINYGDFSHPDFPLVISDVTESSITSDGALYGQPSGPVGAETLLRFQPSSFEVAATDGDVDYENGLLRFGIEADPNVGLRNIVVSSNGTFALSSAGPDSSLQASLSGVLQIHAINGVDLPTGDISVDFLTTLDFENPVPAGTPIVLGTIIEPGIELWMAGYDSLSVITRATVTLRAELLATSSVGSVSAASISQIEVAAAEPLDVSNQAGDINFDGVLTDIDVQAMAFALLNPDEQIFRPDGSGLVLFGFRESLDLYDRGDGVIDFDDLAVFTQLLTEELGSSSEAQQLMSNAIRRESLRLSVPEPSSACSCCSVAIGALAFSKRRRHPAEGA